MTLFDIALIALPLSADAAALTLADSLAYRGTDMKKLRVLPIVFAAFQAAMPVIAYFTVTVIGIDLGVFSRLFVCAALMLIGLMMVYSYFRPEKHKSIDSALPMTAVIVQALCVSLDELAVGAGLAVTAGGILFPALIMGAAAFLLCCASLYFGKKLAPYVGAKAELIGGIIITAIGIKALFT